MSAAGVGIQLVISVLVCLYIGQWLDRKLGTSPWLMIVGVFLGAGAGFYAMFRMLAAGKGGSGGAKGGGGNDR